MKKIAAAAVVLAASLAAPSAIADHGAEYVISTICSAFVEAKQFVAETARRGEALVAFWSY